MGLFLVSTFGYAEYAQSLVITQEKTMCLSNLPIPVARVDFRPGLTFLSSQTQTGALVLLNPED